MNQSSVLREAGNRGWWKNKGEKHRLGGIQGGGVGPVFTRMPRRSLRGAVAMRRKSCQAQGAVCTNCCTGSGPASQRSP